MSESVQQIKKSRKAKDPNRVKKAPNAYILYSNENYHKVSKQLAKKNPNWSPQQVFRETGKQMGKDYKAQQKRKTTKKRATRKQPAKERKPKSTKRMSLESLLRYY